MFVREAMITAHNSNMAMSLFKLPAYFCMKLAVYWPQLEGKMLRSPLSRMVPLQT